MYANARFQLSGRTSNLFKIKNYKNCKLYNYEISVGLENFRF